MRQKYKPIQLGDRFYRWTVITYIGVQGKDKLWLCRCECGIEKKVFQGNLRKGRSMSCGCWRRENSSVLGKRHKRHGESGDDATPEYIAWCSMMRRCYSLNAGNFNDYGARGITVAQRWHVYENFLADMGRKPSLDCSPDRYPDQRGNYEPGNVRWATPAEQARNRIDNRLITINGETRCAIDWYQDYNIPSSTFHNRIRRGWVGTHLLDLPRSKQGMPTVAATTLTK